MVCNGGLIPFLLSLSVSKVSVSIALTIRVSILLESVVIGMFIHKQILQLQNKILHLRDSRVEGIFFLS